MVSPGTATEKLLTATFPGKRDMSNNIKFHCNYFFLTARLPSWRHGCSLHQSGSCCCKTDSKSQCLFLEIMPLLCWRMTRRDSAPSVVRVPLLNALSIKATHLSSLAALPLARKKCVREGLGVGRLLVGAVPLPASRTCSPVASLWSSIIDLSKCRLAKERPDAQCNTRETMAFITVCILHVIALFIYW